MNKKRFALLAACIGVLSLSALWAAAQEDMKEIRSEAFAEHTRPPAVFMHDEHNEKANLNDDCAICHHGKDDKGRQDKEDMSAGTPCAECHAVDGKEGTPLKRAYHGQCITCHEQRNLGPTYCAGCHKK